MKKMLALAVTAIAGTIYAAPNCVKGIQCGNTCISRDKTCTIGLPPNSVSPLPPQQPVTAPGAPPKVKPLNALRDVTYFPAAAFKLAGGTVDLLEDGRYAFKGYNDVLIVKPDVTNAEINLRSITLNASPFLYDGQLYLPVRALDLLSCVRDEEAPVSIVVATCPEGMLASEDVLRW